MARVLIDNDGNEVRTVNVRPKDLRVGDRHPRFRSINVGSIAERTVYEEEVVESVYKSRNPSERVTYYVATMVAPDGTRRSSKVTAQGSIEIKARS